VKTRNEQGRRNEKKGKTLTLSTKIPKRAGREKKGRRRIKVVRTAGIDVREKQGKGKEKHKDRIKKKKETNSRSHNRQRKKGFKDVF